MSQKEADMIIRILYSYFKKKGVSKAILFGSLSRGSQSRKSDIDILVVQDTEKRFFKRYDTFEDIDNYIQNRGVDLLIYTPSELESISHRPFIKNILTQGRIIYEH